MYRGGNPTIMVLLELFSERRKKKHCGSMLMRMRVYNGSTCAKEALHPII
jgi:hypothetical protein